MHVRLRLVSRQPDGNLMNRVLVSGLADFFCATGLFCVSSASAQKEARRSEEHVADVRRAQKCRHRNLEYQRLQDVSPAEMLPLGVSQILITGSLDWLVPPALGEYATIAQKSGDEAQMTVIEGAGHFEVIAPGTAAWPTVRKAIRSLLRLTERTAYLRGNL
jgi:pimeloyl-ACP methyl ester carboxylesterase